MTDYEDLGHVRDRISTSLESKLREQLAPRVASQFGCFIGCAVVRRDASIGIERLILRALDHAYADVFREREREVNVRRDALYDVIDQGQIFIRYQPIVDLRDQTILGYEAFSLGPAGEFEDSEYLFKMACETHLLWKLERTCLALALKTASLLPRGRLLFLPEELQRMRARQASLGDGFAYSQIQGTKPQTLGYGLNDSPAGLAAWIIEKFQSWCDCNGDPESIFTKDELLTNVMLYWVTETATSAARLYYESSHQTSGALITEPPGRIDVPTGVALFPQELILPPRAWAEAHYNITHWTEMPRGGHFAAFEQPALFVDDLRAFYRDLR